MFAAPNTFFTGTSKLTTYSFPSGTSTWTAPTGVTNLVVASGKGADGVAGHWAGAPYGLSVITVSTNILILTQPNSTSPTYQDVYDSGGPSFNSTTGIRTVTAYQNRYYYNGQGAGGMWNNANISPVSVKIQGTCYNDIVYEVPGYRSTKIADYPNSGLSAQYNAMAPDYYIDDTTGANTTGFGKTFPGGVGAPASTTSFTNVAVTPGTTYTIVNNGALTIQYYL